MANAVIEGKQGESFEQISVEDEMSSEDAPETMEEVVAEADEQVEE